MRTLFTETFPDSIRVEYFFLYVWAHFLRKPSTLLRQLIFKFHMLSTRKLVHKNCKFFKVLIFQDLHKQLVLIIFYVSA